MRVDEMELSSAPSVLDGTEDRRAYFAQELQKLSQQRQFVEVDDLDNMEVFYDITESERHMTQTSCDMRWAPLTRHAVLNEESTDSDLIPELGQPIGSAVSNRICPEDDPREQMRSVHRMDNLRAEVSPLTREQDDTSLADRLPRWTSLHCGSSSWWFSHAG